MSRRDTMAEPSWRVQVIRGADAPIDLQGTVSHESLFPTLARAQEYYDSLYIKGSKKRMQERPAFSNRYYTIKQEDML